MPSLLGTLCLFYDESQAWRELYYIRRELGDTPHLKPDLLEKEGQEIVSVSIISKYVTLMFCR